MTEAERRQRVEDVCDAALQCEESDRAAFVARTCGDDVALRQEVDALLAHARQAEEFLATPIGAVAADVLTDERPSLVGCHIGVYQILSLLGAGGMGEVYRARDTRLSRTVAIKVLPRDKVPDPDRKRRFLQEARAASALNHPNIVTLHDIVHDAGIDFLVMEYVPGKSLDQLIVSKGLPVTKALGYAQQMAGALATAHAAGIVHRDIKPANLIVTPEGQIKILDFGLAKLIERGIEDPGAETRTRAALLTEPGMVMGTAAYMSPEQASGRELDHRTDIFSLGVVMYEMLAGQRPFRGKSQVETMHATINSPAPPLSQPPELQDIVDRALEKDPKDRYQHAGDLALDLRRFQQAWEDKSLLSLRGSAIATPKRRVAWMAAGAAVLALATAVNVWVSRRATPAGDSMANITITPFTADPGYEGDPTFSPDGQTIAYVSDRTGRFDIFLRQVGSTSDVALTRDQRDNVQPAFSPDGKQIAFVSSRSSGSEIFYRSADLPLVGGDVWVMPALGGSARRLAPEGNYPTWSPDGSKIVFIYQREKMYQMSSAGGEPQEIPLRYEVRVGAQIFWPTYSADGRWIFFEAQGGQGNNIFGVPAAGGTAKLLGMGWHPAWDEAAQSIVYSNSTEGKNNSLWSLPFSTKEGKISGQPRPLTVGRGRDWQAAVSRDGKLVAFTAMDTTFNLETVPFDAESGRMLGSPRALTNGTQVIYFMRFSPDGRSVVYQASRGSGTHIWRVDSGAEPVQLTADPKFEDTNPQWSPDGGTIAFLRHATSSTSATVDLWLMAPDGVNPREVLSGNNVILPPRWLPDSSGIVYNQQKDRQYYVYDLASRASRQITNEKSVGGQVEVSADGRWLAYQDAVAGKNTDIRAIPVSGGASRVVVATPHFDFHPSFSPSGNWLYFQFEHKNIYRVPGPTQDWKPAEPVKITNFLESAGLFLEDPQISRDGKQLLYSRGKITGDIWILKRAK